jgi:hypothetical protein
MRLLSLLAAAATVAAAGVPAQSNCVGPTVFPTQTPFAGNNLYGHPNYPNPPGASYTGFSFLFDLTLSVPIDITGIDLDLYDAGGLVNTGTTTVTSPNQVGANANVTFFIFPGQTWVGMEANPSLWAQLGTGTLTVGQPHAASPAVFTTPLNLTPGLWAIAFKVDMTTSGPNPGPLHPMLDPRAVPLTPAPTSFSNAALTITNLQFQRESWTNTLAPAIHWQNLALNYIPRPGHANWTSFGTGCVAPSLPLMTVSARPVMGTTISFQTTGISAGTSFNLWLFGFLPDAIGRDLTQFGLPGCRLYLQLGSTITTNLSPVGAGTASVPLPIPLNPSYNGIVLYGQSAPMTPGLNAGFFASNAVCVALGLF